MPYSPRISIPLTSRPCHANNVIQVTSDISRENKNPHAVALGKMTSKEKASAAQQNGAKGGRPAGS